MRHRGGVRRDAHAGQPRKRRDLRPHAHDEARHPHHGRLHGPDDCLGDAQPPVHRRIMYSSK